MFFLNTVLDRAVIVDFYNTRYVIPSSPVGDIVRESVAGEDYTQRVADGSVGRRAYRRVLDRAVKVEIVDTSMRGSRLNLTA